MKLMEMMKMASEVSDGHEENRIGYECKLDLIELDSYMVIKAPPECLNFVYMMKVIKKGALQKKN